MSASHSCLERWIGGTVRFTGLFPFLLNSSVTITLLALDLDAVHAKGYAFQIELTYRALRAGFRVREVPITFTERVRGQSKMSGSIVSEAMGAVWRIHFAPQPTTTLQHKNEVQV